jgi:hypothetical protein
MPDQVRHDERTLDSRVSNLNSETDDNHLIFNKYLSNYTILPKTKKVTWMFDLWNPSATLINKRRIKQWPK